VTGESKLLEAERYKLLFELRVMQDDKVIGGRLHWRTIVKVGGSNA